MVASGWSSAPGSAYGNCSAPQVFQAFLTSLPPTPNHLWESQPAGIWPSGLAPPGVSGGGGRGLERSRDGEGAGGREVLGEGDKVQHA